jgi:hypothetical protein
MGNRSLHAVKHGGSVAVIPIATSQGHLVTREVAKRTAAELADKTYIRTICHRN